MRSTLHLFQLLLLTICATGFAGSSVAQSLIIENDTIICPGSRVTLHGTPANSGLAVAGTLTTDNQFSGVVNLGFSFTFYGNTYSKCILSPNGFISFDTLRAGQFSDWLHSRTQVATSGPVPGNTEVRNAIMCNFSDIYASTTGGTITYSRTGTAPNRKFIFTFCDVPMYNCTSLLTSFQTVLYEGSNNIEFFIRKKATCTTWPAAPDTAGVAIQGVQNATGTIAQVTPGRNHPTIWTATSDGQRYVPASASNYTITSIPFSPLAIAGSAPVTWYTLPNNVIASTDSIQVTPAQSTTYFARRVSCSDTTIDSAKVSLEVNVNVHLDTVIRINPSYCAAGNGSLLLRGLTPNTNYRIQLNKNGVPQPRTTIASNGAGDLNVGNLTGGSYTFILNFCQPITSYGPYSLFEPPIPVDFTTTLRPTCEGRDTITFTNTTPTPGTINYSWNFGDGGTSTVTSPTHIYTSPGAYSVLLSADNGICRDSIRKTVDTRHPLIAAFNADRDTACVGYIINFKDSSIFSTGPAATVYSWDFGDGTTGAGSAPIHTYTQSGRYRVRMIIHDFVPCSDTAYLDIYVSAAPSITLLGNDSAVCEGRASILTAGFTGATPATYTWAFGDGTIINNTNPVTYAIDSSGSYTLKISAHYGFCPDTFLNATVTVHPFPNVNLGPDTAFCPNGEPIVLADLALTNGAATYKWNTGATASYINVIKDGIYSLTKTVSGCATTDSITVYKNCYLDIPNIFTPNGDGRNEYFMPRQSLGRGIISFKMIIYNRWGQKVYETAALDGRGWDGSFNGSIQPQGVYVYDIDVLFVNGSREHYNGNTTLIR